VIYEIKDWQRCYRTSKTKEGAERKEEKVPQADWITGIKDRKSSSSPTLFALVN
jgi:hypothetical protein